MSRTIALLAAMAPLLASCQIYKSHFQCPPGEGVPCASVSEIESMIVETPCGPDLFIGKAPMKSCDGKNGSKCCLQKNERIVWIAESTDECGEICEARYIKLPELQQECH